MEGQIRGVVPIVNALQLHVTTVTIPLHFGGNSSDVIEGLVDPSLTHRIAERSMRVSCDNAMLVHKITTSLNQSGR